MARTHHLDRSVAHYEWNNALAPRLEIDPGDTVVFDTRDAADSFYSRTSTHADVLNRGPFRGHPLTGPVRVRGALPGDVLAVEILDVQPGADFGWTAIRPGRGLLPEADFSKPFLQIWDVSDQAHARMGRGIAVPLAPFPGVMGTALDEPGRAQHDAAPQERRQHGREAADGGHHGLLAGVGRRRPLQRRRRPRGAGRRRGLRDRGRDDGPRHAPLRPAARAAPRGAAVPDERAGGPGDQRRPPLTPPPPTGRTSSAPLNRRFAT